MAIAVSEIGPIVKVGPGDLGGKARSLPFLDRLLQQSSLAEEFAPHKIVIPRTWVLATDCFSEFIEHNRLEWCAEVTDRQEIKQRFLAAELPENMRRFLADELADFRAPLAVRSSALSEDLRYHTTAGLYSTYFVPNRGPERVRQLENAVKLVYASAFFPSVVRYMREHNIPREEERMAVAIEAVVGRQRGDVFYPLMAGVAQSINYFPIGPMSPTDGVVTLVLGLGRRAVMGLDGMRFCPRFPLVRPTLQSAVDIERNSQRLFDAVNLSGHTADWGGVDAPNIVSLPLEVAEGHRVLHEVASVWDPEAGIFDDSLIEPGPRIVTFNRVLKGNSIPLPRMLSRVLEIASEGFGLPVELEFAVDSPLRPTPAVSIGPTTTSGGAELVLLQARPMPQMVRSVDVSIPEVSRERVLLRSHRALGHGAADGLRWIVFVDPAGFSSRSSGQIAADIAQLNERLAEQNARCLLLGPGRWGSSNRAIGIPVQFTDISRAQFVAELVTDDFAAEPSQGTHFFHNIVSRSMFYATIDVRHSDSVNLQWLRAQPNQSSAEHVRLIRSEQDLSIRVDGRTRTALVFWTNPVSPP